MSAAGVVAFFVALLLIRFIVEDFRWLRAPTRTALGEVRGHKAQSGEDGDTYRAIVEFTDENGAEHIFADGLRRHAQWPPKDAVVEVFYPAGRPGLARTMRPAERRRLYKILGLSLFGLTLVANGFIPDWLKQIIGN